MNARSIGLVLYCGASLACSSKSSAAGDGGTTTGPMLPAAQGAASLHVTVSTTAPAPFCLPGAHWVNVPSSTQGGQQTTASSKGALAVDGEAQMTVECSVKTSGSEFDVSATLKSPATSQNGGLTNPTIVLLTTTIAPDQSDAIGTLSVQDDPSVTTYTSRDCAFSVHPAAAGDQLGIAPGRIWASVKCPTLRDEQSSNTSDVCQIESGYFVLETCTQ